MSFGMARCGRIGPDGQPKWFVGLALGPHQVGRRTLCSGCQHRHGSREVLAARIHPNNPSIVHHGHGFGTESDVGTSGDRHINEVGVKLSARPYRPVIGESVRGGPGQFSSLLAGNHA